MVRRTEAVLEGKGTGSHSLREQVLGTSLLCLEEQLAQRMCNEMCVRVAAALGLSRCPIEAPVAEPEACIASLAPSSTWKVTDLQP